MSAIVKNHFALFGLPECYRQCDKTIKANYLKLQQEIHPDRFAQMSEQVMRLAVDYAADVNHAYRTLREPILRAIYLLTLRGVEWKEEASVALPTEFLMEQMDLREQLAELADEPNPLKQLKLTHQLEADLNALAMALEHALDVESNNEQAALCIRKMQFYAKLKQEMQALESVWHC